MKTSQRGLDFIKGFESFVPYVYDDKRAPIRGKYRMYKPGDAVIGTLTVLYGHTDAARHPLKIADCIGRTFTEEFADEVLAADLDECEEDVRRLVKVPLTQGQFDALVSFTFNCGAGNLKKLVAPLNAGNPNQTRANFDNYVRSKGEFMRGLQRRRDGEQALWDEKAPTVPTEPVHHPEEVDGPPEPKARVEAMRITKGRLEGARFVRATSSGGSLNPQMIVLHDTAGRLNKYSSVDWFASRECKASAHFVVEIDGTITQMVPTDRKAFHAGKSAWKGRSMCNGFALGIEIVNPGKCDANGKAWFGATGLTNLQRKATKEHGDGYWLAYSDAQIKAVKQLCRALCEEYPDCNEIVTHWMISPGRKIDTNPLFPLADVTAFALGQNDDDDDDVKEPTGATAFIEPFRIPAADGPKDAPSVKAKDLAPVSQKVSLVLRAYRAIQAAGAAVLGLFTLDNLEIAKGTVNDVKGLVLDLALPGSFVLLLAAGFLCRRLLGRMVKDFVEGRWTPSKAQ